MNIVRYVELRLEYDSPNTYKAKTLQEQYCPLCRTCQGWFFCMRFIVVYLHFFLRVNVRFLAKGKEKCNVHVTFCVTFRPRAFTSARHDGFSLRNKK